MHYVLAVMAVLNTSPMPSNPNIVYQEVRMATVFNTKESCEQYKTGLLALTPKHITFTVVDDCVERDTTTVN